MARSIVRSTFSIARSIVRTFSMARSVRSQDVLLDGVRMASAGRSVDCRGTCSRCQHKLQASIV